MRPNITLSLFLLHLSDKSKNFNHLVEKFTEFGNTVIVDIDQNFANPIETIFTNPDLVFVTINKPNLQHTLKNPNQVFVLGVTSLEELQKKITKLKLLQFWNSRAKFLIVTLETLPLEEVFQKLWSFNIYKIVVYVEEKTYLWYPYHGSLTIGTPFGGGAFTGTPPRAFTPNPLKVQVVVFVPYVLDPSHGSDISIIQHLGEILQTGVVITHSETPYDFGTSYPNNTVTGMVSEVYHQRVDLALGGFILQPDRFALLDSSYPYSNEVYSWCVPQAGRSISWRQVVVALRPQTWVLIVLVFLQVTVICHRIEKKGVQVWVFTNFAILLGISVKNRSKSYFVLFWTLICLTLTIIYQTEFISLMQRGVKDSQVDSMDGLWASKLEIQIKHSTYSLFGESKALRRFLKRYTKCLNPVECINKVAFGRNSAFFASRSFIDFVKNRLFDHKNQPLIHCFNGGINFSPIFLAMRRDFILRDFIDGVLGRFVEAGLVDFWKKQTFLERKFIKGGDEFKSLDLKFFEAPLFCWVVGVGVSGVVFVMEVLIQKICAMWFS
nr:PREDICTED: uncharacterized protein LOC107399113 [Tribolium castaneum]|eukprot:XP_015840281.1 PREDICTED: uncharacterized protein LOC107399113 [Tribolium castaneum]